MFSSTKHPHGARRPRLRTGNLASEPPSVGSVAKFPGSHGRVGVSDTPTLQWIALGPRYGGAPSPRQGGDPSREKNWRALGRLRPPRGPATPRELEEDRETARTHTRPPTQRADLAQVRTQKLMYTYIYIYIYRYTCVCTHMRERPSAETIMIFNLNLRL